jgi:hypothetical protein
MWFYPQGKAVIEVLTLNFVIACQKKNMRDTRSVMYYDSDTRRQTMVKMAVKNVSGCLLHF